MKRISLLLIVLSTIGCSVNSEVSKRNDFSIKCDTVYSTDVDQETGELFLVKTIVCDTIPN